MIRSRSLTLSHLFPSLPYFPLFLTPLCLPTPTAIPVSTKQPCSCLGALGSCMIAPPSVRRAPWLVHPDPTLLPNIPLSLPFPPDLRYPPLSPLVHPLSASSPSATQLNSGAGS